MAKKNITSWNKSNKIELSHPLEAYHSQHGSLQVRSLSEDGLFISKETDFVGNLTEEGTLNVFFSGGDKFHFQGKVSVLDKRNCAVFKADNSIFYQNLGKLLTKLRKNQHIEICNKKDVEALDQFTGFSRLNFVPEALPELDETDVDSSVKFLGRAFSYPIFITGMTGGVEEGQRINENLASGASLFNIPMGLGSQRIALEHPEYARIFVLKDKFPKLFLFGNIGFSDLLKENDPVSYCQKAIDMVDADAFAVHLNLIQECVQVEGNRKFKGGLKLLETLCSKLQVPLIVKEVGCGISPSLAKRLEEVGVRVLDVGGRGGTSWSQVESYRVGPSYSQLGQSFRQWGAPTAYSLASAKEICHQMEVTATGGIRDGQTVAKACALGASLCGIGLPLFKAAVESQEKVAQVLDIITRQLRITMLATSSRRLMNLKQKLVYGEPLESEFNSYLKQLGICDVRK